MSDLHPILQRCHQGLIVSCQAPVDSPLHDRTVISAIAKAAVRRGAVGVRLDTPAHVEATRVRLPDTPIIGLWKQTLPGSDVYITPQFHHAEAIASAGADIIAIDATLRERPGGETFAEIAIRVRDELGKLVMADIDTLEAAIAAQAAGADIIGTTLYGYTGETQHLTPPGFDLLEKMAKHLQVPIVCEGGIASPQMAQRALELGADMVVVGTAITGIDLLVGAYTKAVDDVRSGSNI
ncbi:MAG: N-acetylmannosamine-6-phosphate 2-epimerase [Cyanobacteriota bacterium]|nr:N-acetylmannosamine-6-phosphate 2-epimerase [Cyanobacteriota bacterium]